MKLVRILALAALVAAATLLAACGDDNKGDGNGGEASPTEATGPDNQTGANGDEGVELNLRAENVQFDKDVLEAPAGAEVSLILENRDDVEHSFSLFESEESEEALSKGVPFAGPSFLAYQFTAPTAPGTYHFRCDIHPDVMKGDFVVE